MPGLLGIPGSHNINALWLWGNAANGRLGNGTTSPNVTSPTQIGSETDWEQVSSGSAHTLAIRNGKLFAWGLATNGRLGNGTTSPDVTSPAQIGSDTGWTTVAAATTFSAGIRDGKLYTWGANANYRTAQGTNSGDTTTPTQVGSDTDWDWVAGSSVALFAIRGGKLYSCGSNANFQTAQGTSTGDTTALTQVGSDTDWEMVRGGGGNGNMAAIKGGKALAWGSNASGITGQNTTSGTTSSPTVLSGFSSDTDWTDISTSGGHSGGIKDGGKLYTWGNNTLYRTGLGTNLGSTNVATRVGSDTDWLRISSQLANCSLATKITFQLWSWGDNTSGRTGQGTSSGTTNAPTRVGTDSDWKKLIVVAGNAATHGVAIKG